MTNLTINDFVRNKDCREVIGKYEHVKLNKTSCFTGLHEDKNPSCYIYPTNYHCFTCGAHGSWLDYLIKYQNYSLGDALISEGYEWSNPIATARNPLRNDSQKSRQPLPSSFREVLQQLKEKDGILFRTLLDQYSSDFKSWFECLRQQRSASSYISKEACASTEASRNHFVGIFEHATKNQLI